MKQKNLLLPAFHIHLHNRLRWQVVLYCLLGLVFLAISTYYTIQESFRLAFPLGGFLFGTIAGVIFSRIYRISWDHGAEQVIGRFDGLGFSLFIVYIIFEIFRNKIIALFVHGPAIIITSFALLSGIMAGRVIGIRGKVQDVLREQNIIK